VILGVLSDLCDGLVRQFKVVVVIHELRHVPPFVGVVRNSSLAVLLAENTPILC
jgi:predicted metallopeptidase